MFPERFINVFKMAWAAEEVCHLQPVMAYQKETATYYLFVRLLQQNLSRQLKTISD